MESPYQESTGTIIQRGAIYKFRPIFWLNRPPLWILRNISFGAHNQAEVYREEQLRDAFRQSSQDHEEDVIARAKVRYVAVLSSTREAQNKSVKTVMVAPFYTLKGDKISSDDLTHIRSNRHPFFYYLPDDSRFPDLRECYINFRKLQFLDKNFLSAGKLSFSLTSIAVKSILTRYKDYLSTE